ncbi:threonine dehydratase [Amycolatopsis pretoriensis]|uniref:threonine ammonia-lyase n=1 Tax=Amycolatopsis pretoriensis TaxID=218821 RepID=A0A1H5RDX1_9PSEU|nr:threonine/serine dehydratase [Amycolatopsis pretoriensis]SEF36582.1 threonine dehydratase [Amycolatopsis pretoriensis]
MELVTISDIEAAAKRVQDVAVRTPLLLQTWDPRETLWLKPESLQPVGAFKVRGAFNAIATLDDERRTRGVIAYSSGNHAQAVAYAAQRYGVPAVIVVPDIAPRIKVEATRGYGAEVIEVPIGEHEGKARELAAERGLTLIPPYDDAAIIAGQGTAGLEIAEDLPDVDVVLVPVSGGGLASGVGTALKARAPHARVIGVEPALAGDATEGHRLGRQVDWPQADRARTIADGLRAQPSDLTFAHLRAVVDEMVTVTEDEIREAMRTLARKARLVAEPSGAVTTAAYLFHEAELPAGKTVAIVSGGNADPALFAEILAG